MNDDKSSEALMNKVMTLLQVRDWLLDLHDNFNGSDPALDDFKFAAESIDAATHPVAWQYRYQFADAKGTWVSWIQADSEECMLSIVARYKSLGCPAEGRCLYAQ